MYRSRGLVAAGLALTMGVSAASCSNDKAPPADGGSGGAAGADASTRTTGGTGGAEAGVGGAAGTADGGTEGFDAGPRPDPTLCGNNVIDPYEDCDDGNKTNGDGCESNCKFQCTDALAALCSDHVYCNGPEICAEDHTCHPSAGNLPDGTICGQQNRCKNGACVLADLVCGDTLVVPGEECDPPDAAKGCSSKCLFICDSRDDTRNCAPADPCAAPQKCNDTTHLCVVAGSPATDLKSCGVGKACVAGVCKDKYCSDGKVDVTGEECDDGNRVDGDGCNNDCTFSCVTTDAPRNCVSTNPCMNDGTCGPKHTCSLGTSKTTGIACGTKRNCVDGNCLPVVCGDGIVSSAFEGCDDGNAVSGDGCEPVTCEPSCVNASDCKATPECRKPVCTNGKCESTPDSSKDTNACDTGGGAATCHNGACTSGTCGNNNKEAGEECDDGNQTSGDGCEPNCTLSCASDSDCTDGDPCNGVETCDTTAHKCTTPASLADGTPCGTGKICVTSDCRPAFCGDGVKSGIETCDPPNTTTCDANCKTRTP